MYRYICTMYVIQIRLLDETSKIVKREWNHPVNWFTEAKDHFLIDDSNYIYWCCHMSCIRIGSKELYEVRKSTNWTKSRGMISFKKYNNSTGKKWHRMNGCSKVKVRGFKCVKKHLLTHFSRIQPSLLSYSHFFRGNEICQNLSKFLSTTYIIRRRRRHNLSKGQNMYLITFYNDYIFEHVIPYLHLLARKWLER